MAKNEFVKGMHLVDTKGNAIKSADKAEGRVKYENVLPIDKDASEYAKILEGVKAGNYRGFTPLNNGLLTKVVFNVTGLALALAANKEITATPLYRVVVVSSNPKFEPGDVLEFVNGTEYFTINRIATVEGRSMDNLHKHVTNALIDVENSDEELVANKAGVKVKPSIAKINHTEFYGESYDYVESHRVMFSIKVGVDATVDGTYKHLDAALRGLK